MIINQLNVRYQHARRYKQIVNILIKYGFGYIVERVGIILPKGPIGAYEEKEDAKNVPQKLVQMLQELGPTFIKLGQILSTRPDLIPKNYITELKKLQDDVDPISYDEVKNLLEEELGSDLDKIFMSFNPEPLAAASIGQVHRAVLKDGQKVVVKIQRPDIDKVVAVDLEILLGFAQLVERHIPETRIYDPVGKIEEFSDALHKELDFTREGFNIDKFSKNFSEDQTVYVPKVFWEATTHKILTIEYIDGCKITEVNKICQMGLDKKAIAENGAKAIMKQIFIHGFFHGDPHPGNILIRPDGKIAFIDFGMMGRIDKLTKYKLAELIIGVVNKDTDRIIAVLLDLSQASEDLDIPEIELDVEDIIERYYGRTLKQINISMLFSEVLEIVGKYRIMLPSNFTLLIKSLITIEGVGLELDPDFNIFEVAKPFVKKLLHERYAPKKLIKDVLNTLGEFNKALNLIPKLIEGVYQRTKNDTIKMDFETRGTERILSELNRMINRIVFSLIVASLIIGSSLIIQANLGPFLYGFPIFGVVGFTTAGVLGLGLVISILRSGRM